MARAYAMYNPLRIFLAVGFLLSFAGFMPIARFLFYYAIGYGSGHVQSLVMGGVLIILGFLSGLFGLIADLVGRNRQLLEMTLERLRKLEGHMPARVGVDLVHGAFDHRERSTGIPQTLRVSETFQQALLENADQPSLEKIR
jgi:hypothetical protein